MHNRYNFCTIQYNLRPSIIKASVCQTDFRFFMSAVFYRKSALWGLCPALTSLPWNNNKAGQRVPPTICHPWMTFSLLTLLMILEQSILNKDNASELKRFSFLVADMRLYTLPCQSVGRSHFWILSGFRSCPNIRYWIAVYPALLLVEVNHPLAK